VLADLLARGWVLLPPSPAMDDWIAHARPAAAAALEDPAHQHWFRHGRSWFVGVHALDNDNRGAIGGGPPLAGPAVELLGTWLGDAMPPWDRGQVSVCFSGYPRPTPDESPGRFAYRLERDAAHLDGLEARGPQRRRFLDEPHAFLLGIPLVAVDAGMAPFVLWQGSHEIMREALVRAFAGVDPQHWSALDLTDIYQAARRVVFAECPRIEITTKPGETYLVHRLTLHGMAPWRGESRHAAGRTIIYFRPPFADPADWLSRP